MTAAIDSIWRVILAISAALSADAAAGAGGPYIAAVEIADALLCTTPGGGAVVLVGPSSTDTVFSPWEEGFDSISPVVSRGRTAAFTARGSDGDVVVVVRSGGLSIERMGPWISAGGPSVDSEGRAWFCADGWLRADGEQIVPVTGTPSAVVSPQGDAVLLLDFQTDGTVVDTRTFASRPAGLPEGAIEAQWAGVDAILSWTPEGTIWLTAEDSCRIVARGEDPSWSECANGLFFSRTVDDGHEVISSSIRFTTLEGPECGIRAPEGAIPVSPSATRTGVVAIDAATGSVLRLVLHR